MNPTDTLTNADLDRLDALAEAATPGPLHASDDDARVVLDSNGERIAETYDPDDGRLFAAARLAIPALIAEVRQLRGAVCPACNGSCEMPSGVEAFGMVEMIGCDFCYATGRVPHSTEATP